MTKTEFAAALAEKAGLSKKDAVSAVDAALELVAETLAKGDKVTFIGFGSFEVRERAEREARNPQDPTKTVHVPARKVPAFKAGKELKAKIAQ